MKRLLQTEGGRRFGAGLLLLTTMAVGCGNERTGTEPISQTVTERVVAYPQTNNYGGTKCPNGKPDYGSHYGGASSC